MNAGLSGRVDSSALAYFRIVFGLVVCWEAWRYLKHDWVDRYFVDPQFLFTYWPFSFVDPWPGWGMKAHFIVLGASGILVALGAFYRVSSVVLFSAMTYVFLLEKVNYLNHLYLVCLLAFLMIFLPANRTWSVDSLRRPSLRSAALPAWGLWILRFQLALPYFFGAIAKFNGDWLQGEPLRMWLAGDTDFPVIGRYFTEEPVVLFMSYGALALDLLVVPLLLWRPTRPFAYLAAILFHYMNSRLFNIGIFPWLMIAGTAVFFPPDWPRRVLEDLRRRPGSVRSVAWWTGAAGGAMLAWKLPTTFTLPQVGLGAVGVAIVLFSMAELIRPLPAGPADPERTAPVPDRPRLQRAVVVLLSVWVAVQVLLPLRHLVVPGEVFWTEEGQRFSWMMLVRSKRGEVSYVVSDPVQGRTWEVMPGEYLDRRQVLALSDKPDMVVQFARYLEQVLREQGHDDVEVRARTAISLNNRPPRPIIDPEVDLTEVQVPWLGSADWILPER